MKRQSVWLNLLLLLVALLPFVLRPEGHAVARHTFLVTSDSDGAVTWTASEPVATHIRLARTAVIVRFRQAGQQPLPLRVDLLGGSDVHQVLGSQVLWKSGGAPSVMDVRFTLDPGWNDQARLRLVGATADVMDGVSVESFSGSPLNIDSHPDWQGVGLLFEYGLPAFAAIILLWRLAAMARPTNPHDPNRWAPRASLAVTLLATGMAGLILLTAIGNDPAHFANGQWPGSGLYLIWGDNLSRNPRPMFLNYAPGPIYFYAMGFKFLRFIGVDSQSLFYGEYFYRILQFAIAMSANFALYRFLGREFRIRHLPGRDALPLTVFALLSLTPDMVATYLQPSPYALVPALLIGSALTCLEFAENPYRWRTLLWAGLAMAALVLWRDEFLLVPVGFLLLTAVTRPPSWSFMRRMAILGVVVYLPAVAQMASNRIHFNHFALSNAEHMGVTTVQTLSIGAPLNHLAFPFEDAVTMRIGVQLSHSPHGVTHELGLKTLTALYFQELARHPGDVLESWRARLPETLLISFVAQTSPSFQEGFGQFFGDNYRRLVWLLASACIWLLPFALFALPRPLGFFLIPGLCALSYVSVFGSGSGYFSYAFLTLAVVVPVGLAGCGRIAVRGALPFWPRLSRAVLSPTGMVTLVMSAILAGSLWLATHDGRNSRSAFDPPNRDFARRAALNAVHAGSVGNGGAVVAWAREVPQTLPLAGGYLERVDGSALLRTAAGMMRLDGASGAVVAAHPIALPPRHLTGYFSRFGDDVYAATIDRDNTTQKLLVLDAGTLKPRDEIKLDHDVEFGLQADQGGFYFGTMIHGRRTIAAQVWRPDGSLAAVTNPETRSYSAPAAADGRLFHGVLDRNVLVVTEPGRNGAPLWTHQGDGNVFFPPRVNGGRVTYVDNRGSAYLLDTATGERLGFVPLGFQVLSSPTVDGSYAYVGGYFGELAAVDLDSSRLLWKKAPNLGPVLASPAIKDGGLFVGMGHWLVKFNATNGDEIWRLDVGGIIRDTPLVIGDIIVVRCDMLVAGISDRSVRPGTGRQGGTVTRGAVVDRP